MLREVGRASIFIIYIFIFYLFIYLKLYSFLLCFVSGFDFRFEKR